MSRLDGISSSRQGRFIGPLLGFFLASIFPNLAIARLQHGSIKFQYDPIPLNQPHQPPAITIFQTPVSTWEHVTKPTEEFQLAPTDDSHQHHEHAANYAEIISTNIESPSEYLVPPLSRSSKVSVKRAISPRYLAAFRRNRYTTRRRYPDYFEYDNYEYLTTPRLRNRRRNNARRPIGFDYDYDYDYDYGRGPKRKQQRKRIKNKNRRDPDYYSDEDFSDDVEPVTAVLRPRQQQTTTPTTTTESTTTPTTTTITNGSTASTPTTTNGTTGYGYGPYTGNENISITYGPPSAIKPIYGVPGSGYGAPLGEWAPSYIYDSPSSVYNPQTSYYSPASHQSPSTSYGSPVISYRPPSSYGVPAAGSPSSAYGAPGVKPSYGPPSTSYGIPSQSYRSPSQSQTFQGARGTNSQSYQLPFSSWYGRGASQSDIVRRVQDIIRYD